MVLSACASSAEPPAPDARPALLAPLAPQSDGTRVSRTAAASAISERLCPVVASCYQPPPSEEAIAACVPQEIDLICSHVDCSGTSTSDALAACVTAIESMTCADSFPALCDAVFLQP
jgi:hypothetical protein